jgi:hypothetical protein
MTDSIREMLRMRDDPSVKNAKLPAEALMSREELVRYMFTKQQEKEYEIRVAAKCI